MAKTCAEAEAAVRAAAISRNDETQSPRVRRALQEAREATIVAVPHEEGDSVDDTVELVAQNGGLGRMRSAAPYPKYRWEFRFRVRPWSLIFEPGRWQSGVSFLGPVLGAVMRPAFCVNDRTIHERKLAPSDAIAYSPNDFGKNGGA
jgi:hypothetical protein